MAKTIEPLQKKHLLPTNEKKKQQNTEKLFSYKPQKKANKQLKRMTKNVLGLYAQ